MDTQTRPYSFQSEKIQEFLRKLPAEKRVDVEKAMQQYAIQLGFSEKKQFDLDAFIENVKSKFSGVIKVYTYQFVEDPTLELDGFQGRTDIGKKYWFRLRVDSITDILRDQNPRGVELVYMYDDSQNKWASLLPFQVFEALVERDFLPIEATSAAPQTIRRIYF